MRSFAPLLILLQLFCCVTYALDGPATSLSAGATPDGADAISTALDLFPKCAVTCLMQEIPTSPCGLNTTCVCHDMDFQARMASCLTVGCPRLEALTDTHGVGMDIWVLPPSEIEAALFWFIIAELFYFLAQGSVKISILLFVLRIFPERGMRRLALAVIGIVAAYTLAFLTATLFQCQPITYTWKQLYDDEQGRCNNIHLQGWMSAIFNIVLDILIIVLPIKPLWGLQLSVARKITAIAMFSLGAVVTIISILRLQSLIDFSKSINLTWDSRQAGSWSQCELYVAIICACLPVLRVVIITLGHRYLGWSMAGSAIGGSDKSRGHSGSGGPSTGASASTSRRPRMSQSRRSRALSAADAPRGDFIRLDDLESGPTACESNPAACDSGPGEKSAAGKAAGRSTIVVTRRVSIQSDR